MRQPQRQRAKGLRCAQSRRTRVNTQARFAAEQEILDAAPAAFHQGVPPRAANEFLAAFADKLNAGYKTLIKAFKHVVMANGLDLFLCICWHIMVACNEHCKLYLGGCTSASGSDSGSNFLCCSAWILPLSASVCS
jgi:hypothetical protein